MRFLILLLLTGCAALERGMAQEQYEKQQRQANYVSNLEARCRSFGFPDGPELRQCVLQLHSGNAAQMGALQNQLIMQQMRPMR